MMQVAAKQGQTPTPAHAVWGLVIGEVGATLFCLTAMLTSQPARQTAKRHAVTRYLPALRHLAGYYKNLLSLAIPLTANRLLGSIFTSLESLLIPLSLRAFGYTASDALSVYGILTGMVFSTIMFPAVLSNSLSVMLLPAISNALRTRKSGPGPACSPAHRRRLSAAGTHLHLRLPAVRELDRRPSVPQYPGRVLSGNPGMDLPLYFSGQHPGKHPAWTGQSHHHAPHQPVRLLCTDSFHLSGNPPGRPACLPLGNGHQPDFCRLRRLAVHPAKCQEMHPDIRMSRPAPHVSQHEKGTGSLPGIRLLPLFRMILILWTDTRLSWCRS